MKTAHTPAPWQVLPAEAERHYLRVRATRPGARYKVANVHAGHDGAGMSPEFVERETAETIANARLIAAAPELLAALFAAESAIQWWQEEHGCCAGATDAQLRTIAAAINKATT